MTYLLNSCLNLLRSIYTDRICIVIFFWGCLDVIFTLKSSIHIILIVNAQRAGLFTGIFWYQANIFEKLEGFNFGELWFTKRVEFECTLMHAKCIVCGIQHILDCMAENSIPTSQQWASITSIIMSLLLALSIMIVITWTTSALKLKNAHMDIRPCFECHRALKLTKRQLPCFTWIFSNQLTKINEKFLYGSYQQTFTKEVSIWLSNLPQYPSSVTKWATMAKKAW